MAYGKIARLPPHIRDELSRRLDKGEMGAHLVEWLNTLPEVKQVLESEFDSREISEQNLSEWKEHGYRRWRAQRDSLAVARQLNENASELSAHGGGQLTESLATVVAARYAALLESSQEEITDELRDELKVLKAITREVVRLRRINQMLQQLQIKHQRLQLEQSKYDNRQTSSSPHPPTPDPESLTQEEKDRRLQEWLYPRHLFPERYEDAADQDNGGEQNQQPDNPNQT